jgi:hypothetical protein
MTIKGPLRQLFFVVVLPDGTVVEPRGGEKVVRKKVKVSGRFPTENRCPTGYPKGRKIIQFPTSFLHPSVSTPERNLLHPDGFEPPTYSSVDIITLKSCDRCVSDWRASLSLGLEKWLHNGNN